jgi:mercuric ion transport protein
MKVEVLYLADCPNHGPTVERVRKALRSAGIIDSVEQVEIRTNAEAEKWCFPGSPTVRVNGHDIEPEARSVQHFGLGCRSYAENGIRAGMPSEELIQRAISENPGASSSVAAPSTARQSERRRNGAESTALITGGIAAVLASTCCLGPLILVTLGFSGAWIGNLSVLEPYRIWFIGTALIALFFAGRRMFRSEDGCEPGEVCALPSMRRTYKVLFGIVTGLVVIALAYPYVAPLLY